MNRVKAILSTFKKTCFRKNQDLLKNGFPDILVNFFSKIHDRQYLKFQILDFKANREFNFDNTIRHHQKKQMRIRACPQNGG